VDVLRIDIRLLPVATSADLHIRLLLSLKLIEYHRIITMTEERLTKKSVIKAEQIGSINLLDDAYAILKKHNITYNDSQIKNMTANQWRRLVQKKVNDTVNKEIMEES